MFYSFHALTHFHQPSTGKSGQRQSFGVVLVSFSLLFLVSPPQNEIENENGTMINVSMSA